jgi:hypothetical protein
MALQLALVFHFNQHTNDFTSIANRTCYRGLLSVLRAHPQLKFNLHLSGTLLRALNWFDSGALDLVRAGLAEGQFELLGSTYAQNIPYACDDWDNAQQIALHRAVLADLFGVAPVSFWNAERCWRQSLVKLIAEQGYKVTLIEDHILRAAKLNDPLPAKTRFEGQAVTVVSDDPALRERFNYAAWFGRRAQFFKYLDEFAARPNSEKFVLAYAEDAEAMGLWNWEAGYMPQAAWAHLDALLSEFETQPERYTLVPLGSVQPRRTLKHLPDGSAAWMDAALRRADAPYHEDGYANWFDYLQHSSKLQHFRKLYAVVRSNLQQVGEARKDVGYLRPAHTAADRFYRQALETYCSHQYEFGCIGVGGRGYWGWENVRATFLYSRLAEIAENLQPRRWIEDLNGDGTDEQIIFDGRQLAVFTAFGGRLVGWFDLVEGRQWVGNPLAVPDAPYPNDHAGHPRLRPARSLWLPDSFEADLKPWKAARVKEAAPTRMGRYLSNGVFERDAELIVYPQPAPTEAAPQPRRAQTGALNDWIKVDRGDEQPPDSFLDYRFEPDWIAYLNALTLNLVVDKRVRLIPEGIAAHYTLRNLADRKRRLRWRLSHEMNPDYAEVLLGGQAALQAYLHDGRHPAVVNTRTQAALVVEASRPWTAWESRSELLALDLWLTLELEVPARGEAQLELNLMRINRA